MRLFCISLITFAKLYKQIVDILLWNQSRCFVPDLFLICDERDCKLSLFTNVNTMFLYYSINIPDIQKFNIKIFT